MQQDSKLKMSGSRKLWPALWICLVAIVVLAILLNWLAGEMWWSTRARLNRQITDIKAGKTDWLIDPDPSRLEDVLKDVACSSRVTWVTITGPRMSDGRLCHLREFPRLKIIWLEYSHNADAFLRNIHGMTSLEEISFHHAPFSKSGAQHLGSFPHLTRLRLDNVSDATLEDIKGLTQLQLLELDYGDVDDAGLEHLAEFTRLKTLDLVYTTQVTRQGVKKLQRNLPNCKITVE